MVWGRDGKTEQGRSPKKERGMRWMPKKKMRGDSRWSGQAAFSSLLWKEWGTTRGRRRRMWGWDEWSSREISGLLSVRGLGTAGPGLTGRDWRHSPALPCGSRRFISFRVKNPARGGQVEARLQKGHAVIQPILHSVNKQVLADTDGCTC